MKDRRSKLIRKLVCMLIVIAIFMSSFSATIIATGSSPMQNALLTVFTLTSSQRNGFVAFILKNLDEMTLEQRVAEAQATYLPLAVSADIQALLVLYDSYTELQKDSLRLFIIEGIPTNVIIGSTSNFSNIAVFINSLITDNDTGTVNGQTNVGVRLMVKVFSTAASYVGPVAHDSTSDPTNKIHLGMPQSTKADSLVNSLMGLLDMLKSKIDSRPEATNLFRFFGYSEDGINNATNYSTEMQYFKKFMRIYDKNIYDGTNYYIPLGDINDDNKITSVDALKTLMASTGRVILSVKQRLLADVTKDGKVNSLDALRILQFSTGRITNF